MSLVPGTPALRGLFALDPSVTFLNHGSFGACPKAVLAVQAALRAEMEAEPVDFMMRRYPVAINAARERIAAFVGANPEGIVFVPNASTGVASVLGSLDWREGDEIVVGDHNYGAVHRAIEAVAARRGVRARVAKMPFPLSDPEEIVAAFSEAITPRTRLMVVDHITSATALILPVEQLVAMGHGRGVPVLVDGAHAPGMVPLALDALGADFYTGNLHKWLCAPKGSAILHVAPAWRDRILPPVISHGYHGSFQQRFDWTGTHDPSNWMAVPATLDHYEGLGAAEIQAANHELVRVGREVVAEALGVALPHPDEARFYGSMAAIPFPRGGTACHQVLGSLNNRMFQEHRIEVPFTAYDERVFVRISGQIYNRAEDYEKLADVLRTF